MAANVSGVLAAGGDENNIEDDKITDKTEKVSRLPLTRIKHIMKMDPDVTLASQEAVFLISKATELFIEILSKESYSYTSQAKKKTLQKKDVDSSVDAIDAFVFLEALLERVFLRVGSAETDEQLQNAISKFLLPVLLKLSSQQEGVRKKVMELLVHINKRVKSRSKIQLPVDALLLQYQDPAATSFVTNFTIIYIKMGFPRLDIEKQVELAPCLLNCIEGKPQSHQDSLFMMLMPVLGNVKVPSDPEKRRCFLGLYEKPTLTKLLLDFILDVLLLPYGFSAPQEPKKSVFQMGSSLSSSYTTGDSVVAATITPPPPGLSDFSFKRVVSENPPSSEELAKMKLGLVKFLGGGFLPEENIVVPLIIASSDTRHSVVDAAELELKRMNGGDNVNNSVVISKIYSLFLGTLNIKDPKLAVKPELKRTAANGRIRMKLMPYLLKSREAPVQFPACIQIVFDCLFSATNTNQKLKHMAIQFVHHICLNCSESRLTPIAPILLSGMEQVISEVKDDAKLRSLAYIAIAKLGQKLPHLVAKDMRLLQSFFEAASQEAIQETRLAIQEALSIMSNAFKNLDAANMKIMEGLLSSCLEKPEPQVRLLAVQYAAKIFSSDHIPSRYLLLLAAGDAKEEVYADAMKALKTVPTKRVRGSSVETECVRFPPFIEMVQFICEKAKQRLKSKQKYVMGTQSLPFSPVTCTEVVTYLRMCLKSSAGLTSVTDQNSEDSPAISKYVRRLLIEDSGENGAIGLYLSFVKQLLVATGGTTAMYSLFELVAMAPELLASHFVNQLEWIKGLMFSTKEDMRIYASQLYAIVIANSYEDNNFEVAIRDLMKYGSDKVLEHRQAAVFALGYALARKSMLLNDEMTLLRVTPISSDAVKVIIEFLKDQQSLFVSSACVVLGEIGRFGSLPLPNDSEDAEEKTKLLVIKELTNILKSSKLTAKVQEKAAIATGYICAGESNFPHRQVALEGLLASAGETKDVDLHFTIGESLSWTALGHAAPIRRDFWTTTADEFSAYLNVTNEDEQRLRWLVSEICNNYVTSQNPHKRQASCVWLLSILKCCNSQSAIKDNLETLQSVFIRLISESNETTQDMASKGLGLIYEICDENLKNKLVSVLVDTLMNGHRPVQHVTEDTKIFEEGTLGTAPQGGGLSTYKEICSLASDLNQPDLIYKFMHLANHNAMWNSKKGAAFGFGTIAAKAGEQLQPYLSQIIPKLYRYQYDPNTKIQQSMSSIWNAIVTDPQKMIDQYLKEILADLKVNLTSGLWRTRESSCLALADLLKGRQVDNVVDDLADLWEICFRVRDDIKESVRLAAEASLKTLNKEQNYEKLEGVLETRRVVRSHRTLLSKREIIKSSKIICSYDIFNTNVSIRLCDSSAGNSGHKAIAVILPVLLKSGLSSPVIEVRTISLTTIIKIGKNAGSLLKPHIPLLTVALLESLSSLERQELNYLSVRLGNEQNTQEKLDNARISVSKSSPMMDTVNQCLPFVDDQVLAELIPRLVDLIKSSVGLSTKAGCAYVIISLTHHCLSFLQPHAGRLLSALLFGLNDRSAAIRKTYASAIGHVVKAAKDSSVEKLIDRLRTSYLEKEEVVARQTCGYVLSAISKQSPDVLKLHSARVLPLVFLAMHATKSADGREDDDSSIWEEIWTDSTSGSESGIRLYLSEIVEIVQIAVGSQAWSLKAQGAASIDTVATKMKTSLSSPYLETLLRVGLIGLGGRTWEGKEHLLKSVTAICVNCRTALEDISKSDSSVDINEVLNIMLKECRKDNVVYKLEAISCTAKILNTSERDRFEDMFNIIKPLLEKNGSNKNGDSDDETSVSNRERPSSKGVAVHEVCFDALGKSWPKNKETQEMYRKEISQFLCSFLENRPLKIQVSVLKSLKQFLEKLQCFQSGVDDNEQIIETLSVTLPAIYLCADDAKSSNLRSEILAIFEVVLSNLKALNKLQLLTKSQIESMQIIANKIVTDSQADLREQGNRVIKLLSN